MYHFIIMHIISCVVFEVGVSCRILHSSIGYLYVSGSGSINSVGEERANVIAIVSFRGHASPILTPLEYFVVFLFFFRNISITEEQIRWVFY